MTNRSLSQILQTLFSKHRWSILATYGLTLLENLFELLYPWVIGLTIDGLLQGRYTSLLVLTCTWLTHTIVEVSRNLYDTRTFTQIYRNLASTIVLKQEQQGVPTSQIVARSALSREFVDFFEQEIPRLMAALFGFVGALVMLAFYDLQIALYCLLLLLPLAIFNHFYARQSRSLNHQLNSQLEREVDILTECQPESVWQHYRHLSTYQIRLSDAAAINWGVMEILIIGLFMAVLLRTVSMPGVKPGDIYAIISYTWSYRLSLDLVPTLVQQLSRLQDIGDRMQTSPHLSSESNW
jgi:ABC-type multidrug transport system fused ATPase/permease subunit